MRPVRAIGRLSVSLVLAAALAGCGSPEEKAQEYLASARKYIDGGDVAKADIELRNALKLDPRLAEAHYLRSRVFESNNALPDAMRELQSTVQIDENHLEANLRLAAVYAATKNPEEAQAAIDRARKTAPDDFRIARAEAILLAMESRLEEAAGRARKALEASPKDLETQMLLSGILVRMRDYAAAAALVDTALGDHPEADQAYIVKFQIQSAQEQVDAAAATLRQLISRRPDNTGYRNALAAYLSRNHRASDAEAVLRQSVADLPASKEAKLALASYLSTTDTAAAVDALKGFIARGGEGTVQLQLALADLYTRRGNLEEAAEVYQAVSGAEDKEESLAAKNQLARIAFKKGSPEEAAGIVEGILTEDPGNAEALLSRAGLRLAKRETDDAIMDIRQALGQDPGLLRGHLLLAQAHLQNGAVELASASLVEALKLDPKNEEAAVQLASLMMRERRFDKVLELLRPLSEGGSPSDRVRGLELQARLASKDWSGASSLAGQMGEKGGNPQYQKYIEALGLQAQGRHAEAAKAFSEVFAARPEMLGALAAQIRSERELGKGAEAVKLVKTFVDSHPENLEARQLYVTELLRDDKTADARAALEAGLAKDPHWLVGYRGLGAIAVREKNVDKAIAEYERALAANPDAMEFKLLAATLEESKDKAAAEARYREVLAASPGADIAANNLAVILAGDGKDKARLAEAISIAKRFESSQQPFLADTYAWALYLDGDYAKAASILDRVVKAAPDEAIFRYHLGAALYMSKDLPSAKVQLARAEKLAEGGQRFEGYEDAMALLAKIN